jgi:hypothetical protein
MLARRIRTGFHRLGLAVALLFGVPGLISVIAFVPFYLMRPGGLLAPYKDLLDEYDRPPGADDLWQGLLIGGAFAIGVAAATYVIAWTLGWIIAGFAGDNQDG